MLTEIPWNSGNFPQLSGKVSIVDVLVSGYFGAEMSSETGDPFFIGPNLSTVESKIIPDTHTLYSAYPNPFNPTTRLRYELSNSEYISINIYDLNGKYVKSLVNSIQGAGYWTIVWDATNNLGQPVSAGMYIYTIQAGEFRQTRKMVLLK